MQLREQPDSELVRQVQSDDAAAFDELMRRYKRPIVNFIFRMLGNAQDSDEVAQDVFVRVYQNVHTYRPETKFSTGCSRWRATPRLIGFAGALAIGRSRLSWCQRL